MILTKCKHFVEVAAGCMHSLRSHTYPSEKYFFRRTRRRKK